MPPRSQRAQGQKRNLEPNRPQVVQMTPFWAVWRVKFFEVQNFEIWGGPILAAFWRSWALLGAPGRFSSFPNAPVRFSAAFLTLLSAFGSFFSPLDAFRRS